MKEANAWSTGECSFIFLVRLFFLYIHNRMQPFLFSHFVAFLFRIEQYIDIAHTHTESVRYERSDWHFQWKWEAPNFFYCLPFECLMYDRRAIRAALHTLSTFFYYPLFFLFFLLLLLLLPPNFPSIFSAQFIRAKRFCKRKHVLSTPIIHTGHTFC